VKHMNRHKLLAYTQSFLSFVFSDTTLWKPQKIKSIILFGSVARGDFTKESDIDIFFEADNEKNLEFIRKTIETLLSQFLRSDLQKQWLLRGVKNEIRPFVSTLNKTTDLKKSLIADGIVLFGEYKKDVKLNHYILFTFNPIENKNKRYRIDRYLFGRTEKERKKEGIIKDLGGIKIDSRTFILLSQQSIEVSNKFKKEKIDFKSYDIWAELS